jgi:hypothetical protein
MTDKKKVPARFAHLVAEIDGSEYLRIAETKRLRSNDMRGMRSVTTGLVPLNRLRRVLDGEGRQGWLRTQFSSARVYRKSKVIHGPFDLVTPEGLTVEALVDGWTNDNLIMALPQPELVATYGLRPRMIELDQSIRWDDPEHATYDVVIVRPVSRYEMPNDYTPAEVLLRLEYARDYATTRNRAIVEVYYEQQSIAADAELEELLGDQDYARIDLPGVGIEIKRTPFDTAFPLFLAAWGCRLLVRPDGTRPVTDDPKPELEWPGCGVIDSSSDFSPSAAMDYIYVRDEVLTKFEERGEYDVDPESGAVSYEGRWELSYSHRVSRDFIAYELRKLYEGCPSAVIRHVHAHTVEEAVADAQRHILGHANIGARAAKIVAALATLHREILALATTVHRSIEAADIAEPTPDEIDYYGWWTFDHLRPLGRVAPLGIDQDGFLKRVSSLWGPFERLKEKPLRQIATTIGIPAEKLSSMKSLKLLGTIAQLADIADASGLSAATASAEIAARWNAATKLDALRPLFALNDLRQLGSHTPSSEFQQRLAQDLGAFGVDALTVTGGWGTTLDAVYDRVAESLDSVGALLRRLRGST